MPSRLHALVLDALDPAALATFWSGLLGREVIKDDDGFVLPSPDGAGFQIDVFPTSAARTGPNRLHLDLTTSSLQEQQQTVARILDLGGSHLDIGQGEVDHVVMADPEGNELCVIEPGNGFLADTGLIGALSCDGSRGVGLFWSSVLDWPLVWDEGEETAIQSPQGGTKISWGGPPFAATSGKNRWHLDLVPDDQVAEVARLESLGAKHIDIGQGEVSWVVMADPDGNELCVLTPR